MQPVEDGVEVDVLQAPAAVAGEAGLVGGAQAQLALPLQHEDTRIPGSQLQGDLACTVGRVVVHHQDVDVAGQAS